MNKLTPKKTFPKVVTIGGGTGSFVVLSGLKEHSLDIAAIVTMMDSGGSTGKLRDQLGVLPPGDLRQALVALSEASDIWRKLFTYRFSKGDLKGHNFGNLFLSALEMITGSNQEAIDRAADLLQVKGRVLPVTFDKCSLCAQYKDGSVVEGEANIEDTLYKNLPISHVYLKPKALLNLEAKRAIERADYIIFGPGDIYTSIFPSLVVDGMFDILQYSHAKKIYISNLMTRRGQTDDFKVSDFITEVEKYIGTGKLDYIFINDNIPDKKSLRRYEEIDSAFWVKDDIGGTFNNAVVIRDNFLEDAVYEKPAGDILHRSLIRHSGSKLAKSLLTFM